MNNSIRFKKRRSLQIRSTLRTTFSLSRSLFGIIFLLTVLLVVDQVHGANVQLCTFLSSGGTKTLNPADTYQLAGECPLSKSVTINGNGVNIAGTGPLHTHGAGVTLTANNFIFNSTGWAALAASDGSQIVLQNNSSISCPGGSGIFAATGSSVTVQNSSINSSTYGINLVNPSTGTLHGVNITGCPYAVMANGTSCSVTVDQNSSLAYDGDGAGIALMNGGSGIVHDSTLRGFLNAIDIKSGGTAEVVNCTFENNGGDALMANNAQNVLFSGCTVRDALQDGIFFYHSTGIVEESQIIGSLNTGVSFIGCSNGATIRDSLVKNSAHNGVAIVADGNTPSTSSLNIQVLNNTFVANVLNNLLMDATSTAKIQGNIFTQTPGPNYSIRLWGTKGITLDSALITDSFAGVEIKGGSDPKVVLSDVSENDKNGFLAYEGSTLLTAEHSFLWNNGLTAVGGTSDSYSIFINTGANVNAHRCTFGPAGKWALYNNTTNSCDVSNNYWNASDGPNVASWIRQGANGSGAHLDSSYSPLGPVTYTPFLTQPPVDSFVDLNVSLPSGGSLSWGPALGVTLQLTAKPDSTALSGEIAGVLRVNDTASLNSVVPPPGLVPGQIYVVWVSTPLRLNSGSGSLKFSLPSEDRNISLKRRETDGTWTLVPSIWDAAGHLLTYSPTDTNLLNGTFALIADDWFTIYVSKESSCNDHNPCSSNIQNGIGLATAPSILKITQETYDEDIILDFDEVITLQGGWDTSFTSNSSYTTINGSITITNGTMTFEFIIFE